MKTLLALSLVLSTNAFPWDAHNQLTELALRKVGVLNETCEVTSKESAFGKNITAWNDLLKINKGWNYEFRAKEKIGQRIPIREILGGYADEPDWGVDADLFSPGQYPELWRNDLKYVTKKEGRHSKGFRHLYFQGRWKWSEPIESFQIPQMALGENPDRAVLFFQKGAELLKRGECYWGYRMLAWSLHYIEDLTQPYHVRQTPSKHFIKLSWKYFFPTIDVKNSGDCIAYYHLSYEDWARQKLSSFENLIALHETDTFHAGSLRDELEDLVSYIVTFAGDIGKESITTFEPWEAGKKVVSPIPILKDSPILVDRTATLLGKLGKVVRGWVNEFQALSRIHDTRTAR